MKKGYLVATILLSLTITSNIIFAAKQAKSHMGSQPPTVVKTVKAHKTAWQDTTKAVGTLSAFEGITVSPEVSGRITKIYFQSGQYVNKNDPIIQINPDIIKAQLKRAKSQLRLNELDYPRFYQLYKKGFYDKADLDKSYAKLEASKAQVAEIQAQLDQTYVRAAFAGKLGLREISLGDFISPGKPLVSLQKIDPLRVDFSIPERYLSQLKIGSQVKIVSRALANKKIVGKIFAFNSIIDENTRTLDMRAEISNPEHNLLPGMFVEVTVYLGHPIPAIIIPQTALIYSLDGNYLYRVVNNKAVKTVVIIGRKLVNNQIIIENGINENDVIITDGQEKVHDGSPVVLEQTAKKTEK